MRYDESNLNKRIAHFELLNKLAEKGKLSEEDSKQYIFLLVKQNPYTYQTSPMLEVRKPDKKEKKQNIKGVYCRNDNTLHFLLSKENITCKNLRQCVGIVGHDMKHYYQHKNVSSFLKLNDTFTKQKNYKRYIYNNTESLTTHSGYDDKGFLKGIHKVPLKCTLCSSLFKLKISKRFFTTLSFAVYYTYFHEYDARKAQENFAYGMMKSYANDPLIENYPKVKKMFSNYLDNNSQIADENHMFILHKLKMRYSQQLHLLPPLKNSLTKLALKGKLKDQQSVNALTAHLLSIFYDKDTNIKIIENNIDINKNLSNLVNFLSLYKCPKQDLKDFQELYVKNVLNGNFKSFILIMLTNEQNQQIVDKVITKDKDLKALNAMTRDDYFKHILTEDYKTKMVNEIINTFKDEEIDYLDLFNLSMDLIPLISDDNAIKLDEFYKKKYNEIEKNQNGNYLDDLIYE